MYAASFKKGGTCDSELFAYLVMMLHDDRVYDWGYNCGYLLL